MTISGIDPAATVRAPSRLPDTTRRRLVPSQYFATLFLSNMYEYRKRVSYSYRYKVVATQKKYAHAIYPRAWHVLSLGTSLGYEWGHILGERRTENVCLPGKI